MPTPHGSEHHLHDILTDDGYTLAATIADLNANESLAESFPRVGTGFEFTLLLEDAGYRDGNELGIFSLLDNTLRAVIFNASDDPITITTLEIPSTIDGNERRLDAGVACCPPKE